MDDGPDYGYGEARAWADADKDLICIDGGSERDGCDGAVEWRTSSDREDFKHFLRCEAHGRMREARARENLELMSPCPAPWFDPSYAGERWDED